MGEIIHKEKLVRMWLSYLFAGCFLFLCIHALLTYDHLGIFDIALIVYTVALIAYLLLSYPVVYFGSEGIRLGFVFIGYRKQDIPMDKIISISIIYIDSIKRHRYLPFIKHGKNKMGGVCYYGGLVRDKGILVKTIDMRFNYLIPVRDPEAVLEKLREHYPDKVMLPVVPTSDRENESL